MKKYINVFISESRRKVSDFHHGIIKTKKCEAESGSRQLSLWIKIFSKLQPSVIHNSNRNIDTKETGVTDSCHLRPSVTSFTNVQDTYGQRLVLQLMA